MADMTWMTGFQAGANLALNAERMRQQREESRLQAAQLMQQIQASRALDAYRKQESERQRQAMMIQQAKEQRDAQIFQQEQERYNALQAWRQGVPGRMQQTGHDIFLGGGQGPLTPYQEEQAQPEAIANRIFTEGTAMFADPNQFASMSRGITTQEGQMERALLTDRTRRDLAADRIAMQKERAAQLTDLANRKLNFEIQQAASKGTAWTPTQKELAKKNLENYSARINALGITDEEIKAIDKEFEQELNRISQLGTSSLRPTFDGTEIPTAPEQRKITRRVYDPKTGRLLPVAQ